MTSLHRSVERLVNLANQLRDLQLLSSEGGLIVDRIADEIEEIAVNDIGYD